MVPTGFINQTHIANEVSRAILKLGPEVVRVKHSVGEDTGGDPAIYFRIVLTDAASRKETLANVTEDIATILINELRPLENWGLFPYFGFRSESEQATRSGDVKWA